MGLAIRCEQDHDSLFKKPSTEYSISVELGSVVVVVVFFKAMLALLGPINKSLLISRNFWQVGFRFITRIAEAH